jgi:heme oxygenase (biliverdin-IX-beta and delta-forming)
VLFPHLRVLSSFRILGQKNEKAGIGLWRDLLIVLPVIEAMVSPSILTRLRLETRQEHTALEDVLDLMNKDLSRNTYRYRLQVFYGFYAPFETALKLCLDEVHLTNDLANRLNKTSLLKGDLHHFGVDSKNLPTCQKLPPLKLAAEILGGIYVVEGATLGGRIITKHVQDTLNILPATGGSFFQGYGDATAMMWQGMRQLLVSAASDVQTENAIVASAIETFSMLRIWSEAYLDQLTLQLKVD